jgi:hypothetical protein
LSVLPQRNLDYSRVVKTAKQYVDRAGTHGKQKTCILGRILYLEVSAYIDQLLFGRFRQEWQNGFPEGTYCFNIFIFWHSSLETLCREQAQRHYDNK